MEKTHITRIHHPSGRLYESFCEFVMGHPEGTFFQSDAFFRFAGRWPGAEAVLLIMVDGSHQVMGSLLAVIIRGRGMLGGLTARTVVWGGPLLAAQRRLQEHMNVDALLKALITEAGSKSALIRFNNFRDWSDFQPVFDSNGFRFEEHHNLLVGTSKRAKAWNGLSDKCRSQVQSSLAKGATVVSHPGSQQVADFHALLCKQYRNMQGVPLPPKAFFEAFSDMCRHGHYEVSLPDKLRAGRPQGSDLTGGLLMTGLPGDQDVVPGTKDGENITEGPPPDKEQHAHHTGNKPKEGVKPGERPGAILLVEYQGRVVGGIVCPFMPGRAMCAWVVGDIGREMHNKEVYPAALATWSAIEYAAAHGIRYFDFMGTGNHTTTYGVHNIREHFGGEPVNHGSYVRVNNRLMHMLANFG